MTKNIITNIDISKDYRDTLGSPDVHYQAFSRLADYFGRDMPAHRHAEFFQIHALNTGQIELQLDDQHYAVQAPLFVITPPSVPHAFVTRQDSDGHVLTIRQHLIWPVLESLYPGSRQACTVPAVCLSLAGKPHELNALAHYWRLIETESRQQLAGREHLLTLLAQGVFTLLLRNVQLNDHSPCGVRGELKLFQRFNLAIEQHYQQHWPLPKYARELKITESRLTDICQRFANLPPKRLIFNRLLREARRLLLFSDRPVNAIAYALGFKDPAYFARFFHRHQGISPSAWRTRHQDTH